MDIPENENSPFDQAAMAVVELGNQLMDQDKEADAWDVASGLLAGAIQFWLFTHQPCADAFCESCAEVSTAELRMKLLADELREFAQESDYYHSPTDSNAGTA
ncbi:MAG: hypothetical protein IV108_13105 [Burkholderiales bacterium]|nr:hypothetical protein [Burkholderiales bacterium]